MDSEETGESDILEMGMSFPSLSISLSLKTKVDTAWENTRSGTVDLLKESNVC